MRRLYFNNVVLVICSVAILGLIILSNTLHVWAGGVSTPVPSAVSTIQMPDALATQQAQISDLSKQVENVNKRSEDLQIKEVEGRLNDKLNTILSVVAVITFVVAFFGIRSYSEIDKVVKEKVAVAVDKEILGFDPQRLPVRLPANRGLEKVQRMLLLSRIGNLEWYTKLGPSCFQGITIHYVESQDEEPQLREFIEANKDKLDPSQAAFVVYSVPGVRITKETIDSFENITLANMPVTVANAVLIVARGLRLPAEK